MPSEDKQLARECKVLSRYLSGRPAEGYVLEKYCDAHRRTTVFAATSAFDRILLSLARIHPALTTIVDTYARFFVPGCALRRKLIVLLAVLESSAVSQHFLEQTDSESKGVLLLAFLGRVLPLAIGLTVCLMTLLPLQLALGSTRTAK